MIPEVLFFLCLLVSASGLVSPPIALAIGLLFGLAVRHPYASGAQKSSKVLLQVSVVGLGFGMNLQEVLRAGRSGFFYTLVGIGFALAAGMGLGAVLGVKRTPAFLISTGTAICGGSAIAAVGPITQASDEEMAVSLGTVFVLNSVALLVFPAIGSALKLTQRQFGLWAALAIHDTSSVVGAAAKYGAAVRGSRTKICWPWFIGLFCVAAVCKSYVTFGAPVYSLAVKVAKLGLTATLFLIGSGISLATIKQVGHRPLLQGILLWLIVSVGSLWLIRMGWIAL